MTKKKTAGRILQMTIVLFGISFLTFCLIYLAPGDPVKAMYAVNGGIPSEEVFKNIREKMGLNDPFLIQYFKWLFNCLHGDFGTSYSLNKRVVTVLLQRLWPTLKLTLFSLILMLAVSIPFGVLSAVKCNKAADYIIRVISFVGISLPGFWLGIMLIYIVALKLKLLPVISADTGFKKLILPAVTLAFSMAAKYTRQVRAAVLEELHKDYVIGARTRGIKERTVLWAHVFSQCTASVSDIAWFIIWIASWGNSGCRSDLFLSGIRQSGCICSCSKRLSVDSGLCSLVSFDLYGDQSGCRCLIRNFGSKDKSEVMAVGKIFIFCKKHKQFTTFFI